MTPFSRFGSIHPVCNILYIACCCIRGDYSLTQPWCFSSLNRWSVSIYSGREHKKCALQIRFLIKCRQWTSFLKLSYNMICVNWEGWKNCKRKAIWNLIYCGCCSTIFQYPESLFSASHVLESRLLCNLLFYSLSCPKIRDSNINFLITLSLLHDVAHLPISPVYKKVGLNIVKVSKLSSFLQAVIQKYA